MKQAGVLLEQMIEIKNTGIDAVILSWWGRPMLAGTADTQGVQTDRIIPRVLRVAEVVGIKVGFHLEPYSGVVTYRRYAFLICA